MTVTANAVRRVLDGPGETPAARLEPPQPGEQHEYYTRYSGRVPPGDLVAFLRAQAAEVESVFGGLTPAQAEFAYAPGKWTVKEMLGHVTDAERVFSYRALHIARADPAPLPGMEQDDWMRGTWGHRTLPGVLDEFLAVRAATIAMVCGLPADAPLRRGIASEREFTVRALLYGVPGHADYHLDVLRRLYLGAPSWPR